jgi:hypothetical protein
MKKTLLVIALNLSLGLNAYAFNLWEDIQQNTKWTIGSVAAAGTAVALKDDDSLSLHAGDLVVSALASISEYRMLSLWYGGNEIPQGNGNTKLVDTAKIGLNLGYFLTGFVNQPPAVIKNLVFGPSVSYSLIVTPRVFVPFFDINYSFGGTSK